MPCAAIADLAGASAGSATAYKRIYLVKRATRLAHVGREEKMMKMALFLIRTVITTAA